MQDTRQQILEIIKRYGEVTVQDLRNELGLTSVTVRHHLEILRSEGYISDPEVSRSNRPGRPRYVYRLTSTAADLFPNNYSGLASALLDAIERQMPAEERSVFLRQVAKCIARRAGTLPEEPRKRIESTVAFLNRQGYASRWEEDQAGHYFIYISSCPYHYVSQTHDEPCEIDRHLLQLLAGERLTVKRLEAAAKDGGLCTYVLDIKGPVSGE